MKYGAWFQRQLIVRNVPRTQRQCRRDVRDGLLEGLIGQRIHQVQVEVIELGGTKFVDRTQRVVRRMDAPEALECARRKTLSTQGRAIDAGLAVACESAAFDRAGIGL